MIFSTIIIIAAVFLFLSFKDKKGNKIIYLAGETVNNTVLENKNVDAEEQKEPKKIEEEKTVPENKTVQEEKPVITGSKIISYPVNWGFKNASNRKIDTIIIHSSYNALGGDEYDLDKLVKEYKEYGVAPHYLIDRKGKIYYLVNEKNIAYHAGLSQVPDGRSDVNNFSIGIEIMNTKEDKPTSEQYASLKNLIKDIKTRYAIKYVLGHNQIAPNRKSDPWNFDWDKI